MWSWVKQFLADYLPWTLVDLLIYTRTGRPLLFFLGGMLMTGVTLVIAHVKELGPAWTYGSLGGLISMTLVSLGLIISLLVGQDRRTIDRAVESSSPIN